MARLTEHAFLQDLSDLSYSSRTRFWVAYSGGLDSQVLLTLARRTLPLSQLKAIHLHHGLHPEADEWQRHCQQYCQANSIPLQVKTLALKPGSSLESRAREARYAVFADQLEAGDILLMAHHQDDQIETMLYHLLRGSGPRGLGGIPASRPLRDAQLARPLLNYSRQEIKEFAETNALSWVEDHSNQNTAFDRNFLRHTIIPALKQRWPEAGKAFQRSAGLLQEAGLLLNELAQLDAGFNFNTVTPYLPLAGIKMLEASRQRNLLHQWFAALAQTYTLPMPGFEELRKLVSELIPAAEDAKPLVSWKSETVNVQARRFRDCLYVLKDFADSAPEDVYTLSPEQSLQLPAYLGTVSLRKAKANELGFSLTGNQLTEIRFSADEKSVKPYGRRTRSLKKIYQDYAVPPWLRDRVPLLYIDDQLAALADLFVCDWAAVNEGENRFNLSWYRADIHCGY
jgi:tRNA(Ile)-lysidine synthase